MDGGAAEVNTSIRKQFLIAGCLYLGQFLVGYCTGWTAPVLAKLQNEDDTPLESVIDDAQSSWIGSVKALGAIVCPYFSGYLCNVIGRKPCLYIGGNILLLAYVILALSTSLYMIFVGRILGGVASGIIFVMNLVYIGEMASTRIRGTMLALTGLCNTSGILFAYVVGPFVPYSVISWIGAVLSVLYLVALFFWVPETAVYQVMKGRKDEAMANLRLLGRQDYIDEIVAEAKEKPKSNMAQLTEMYTVRSNRMAAFIIISLNVFQQASGVIAVMSFVTIIFDMTKSNLEPHISTIIIGITQVAAAIFAPILVDRSGRRILLLVSTAGCSLSLGTLGIYFYLLNSGNPAADHVQWMALASIMSFFLSYFSGFGIIPNTFIGEMFTDTCRGFGGTCAITVGWVSGFGIQTAFGYMLPALGPHITFWIFSGTCALAFVFSILFVPETKGKSLLEIQLFLERRSTRIRGTMLALTGLCNTSGILFAYVVGPFVPYSVISWIGAVLSVLYLVALFFWVPETAVYQVMKGRKDEAMANLRLLGRQDYIDEIVAEAKEKPKSNMAQLTEMYTVRSNRMAAFIIISLNVFQQASGVIAVMSFVTIIFDMTKSNLEPHISTIIIGITQVAAAIFAPILVDRSGRRILLLVSTAGCSLSLGTLGIYFYLLNSGNPAADHVQWMALASIMSFFLSYFSGFGIIPNTFIGEMFTDTCRGFGGTCAITVGWVSGFGIQTAFGYMLPALGPHITFWIFSGTCALAFVFSILFVPETKGKSLLEIQLFLERRSIF